MASSMRCSSFFRNWLQGVDSTVRTVTLYVGKYSWVDMMLYLTKHQYIFICRLSPGGFTGPGPGPYYRRRRIAIRWRWDVDLLRQLWWRCLLDTAGDSATDLLFSCVFFKSLCFRYGSKLCFWDSLDRFILVCNKEQLYALIDVEAGILIYFLF